MSSGPVIARPAALRFRDGLHRFGPVAAALLVGLAVLVLWRREVFPLNFVGEAQSPARILASSVDGLLALEDGVELFRRVEAGQVLAHVRTASEARVGLSLATLKTELEVMRLRLLQDQQRNDLNYLQAWQDLLDQRLQLASARIQLKQAESEFQRMEQLKEQEIVSEGIGPDGDGYEVALRNRDVLRSEVQDREALVAEYAAGLERLKPGEGSDGLQQIHAGIDAALQAQEAELEAAEGANAVRAPISGMIMQLNRHSGEQVARGEALFEIRGEKPEWILGFIRQPIAFRPQEGDLIKVLSRSRPRRFAEAKVIRVGIHLQSFAQPLRVRGFDASQERGLPVLIEYPEDLALAAGELVDLVPLAKP